MSKEHEAFQQRTQDGGIPVYNTAMPGTCVMPGPVLNPMYHGGPGTSQGSNCHRKKSYLEAYMLWLLLGLLGAHHFYLRVSIYSQPHYSCGDWSGYCFQDNYSSTSFSGSMHVCHCNKYVHLI
ncbi:hypothetical protein DPMN_045476 [Dreissena polymorpha]|uniref:TM2 domain-containing protein n=1 Tax=Dreissena polymorpha TaxID=45954 RepID=A0A9D4HZR6_DREPO|nr:hypothetical protein DPMN_045476 [Dreissena polymorpha]